MLSVGGNLVQGVAPISENRHELQNNWLSTFLGLYSLDLANLHSYGAVET